MNIWRDEFGDALISQRVLVTGSSGFIGQHLCRALDALEAEVHTVSRHVPQRRATPRQQWCVDLTDVDAVNNMLREVQPQVVFHLAGLVTGRQEPNLIIPTLQANLLGTLHLLLGLIDLECQRIVIAGSSEELGAVDDIPNSPYGAAKLAATHYAQMFWKVYDLPVVVARIFMGYGPGQANDKLIPYLIRSALTGECARIASGERVYDLNYVTDIVRGLLSVAGQPKLGGHIIELGSGIGVSVKEIAELVQLLTNSRVQPVFDAIPGRRGERAHIANRQATQQLLAWKPRWSLREGLAETVAWYQAELEGTNNAR